MPDAAREEVLRRVREAVRGAAVGAVPRRPDTLRRNGSRDERVERFVERVEDYRAEVVRCAAPDVEAALAGLLTDGTRVVHPPGLPWRVPGGVPDESVTAAELDALDGVVTAATVAVAETGTVVLAHGPAEGRRAISLVPDLHLCVVLTSQVVPDVGDALARLDPRRPTTWISGPSATSDIELERVEGVHGPRRLVVVLADDGRPGEVEATES